MELHIFFLYLGIILLAARFLAEFASRFGVPSVIGELYATLLIVVALTTALPPFALKWFYGRYGDKPGLKSTAGRD